MSDEDLVVIPLPTEDGSITYAVARLVVDGDHTFAEAMTAVPRTNFAPPHRIVLSRYSLANIRPGSPASRSNLYLYDGMIMPPPSGPKSN